MGHPKEMAEFRIQRSLEGTGTSREDVSEVVLDVLGSQGQSLDGTIQRALENRMDADFSNVRIHTGAKAADAADAIEAKAFTCGSDIVFNSGAYDPETPAGQHLLAHELAHVKQQTGAAISMMPQEGAQLEIDPAPQLEWEAEEEAARVMSGEELGIQRLRKTAVHIQRRNDHAPRLTQTDPLTEDDTDYETLPLPPVQFTETVDGQPPSPSESGHPSTESGPTETVAHATEILTQIRDHRHAIVDIRRRQLKEAQDSDSESDSSGWLSSHDGGDSSGSPEGADVDINVEIRRRQLRTALDELEMTEFQLSLHQREVVPAPTNADILALEQELVTVQQERQAIEPTESAVSPAIAALSMTFNTLWDTDD